MAISWKKKHGFKPERILGLMEKARSTQSDGRTSFSGFEIFEHAPVLQSMLQFPSAADDIDKTTLIWNALSNSTPHLTPANFLAAINSALSEHLSKRENRYHLLTSISLDSTKWPKRMSVLGSIVEMYGMQYPRKFSSRDQLIDRHTIPKGLAQRPPTKYHSVAISVRAKSENAAANIALRRLDLLRAIWCLQGNPSMELSLFSSSRKPINVVRLGSCHTLHKADGSQATDGIWYEPTYSETKLYAFKKHDVALRNTRLALGRIKQSKFGNQITNALVRYVRALDDPDPDVAFLGVWSALELLVTPDVANYDNLVTRCSFLFADVEYHAQILNHLREYRNSAVHSGITTDSGRTNCFLLQSYFQAIAWFLLRNSKYFSSLGEAGEYLSLPPDADLLRRRIQLLRKARRFISSA